MRIIASVMSALAACALPLLGDAEHVPGMVGALGNLGGMGLLALALWLLLREVTRQYRADMALEREQRDKHHTATLKDNKETRHLIRNFWAAMYKAGLSGPPPKPEEPPQ